MPTPNDYNRVNFSNSPAPEEHGQVNPSDTYTPSEPMPASRPQDLPFSSDKASTPDAMAAETSDSQNAFAELQNFLMNNLETPGSRICHPQDKPWKPPSGAEG